MERRIFLALGLSAALAACSTAPLVEGGGGSELAIRSVAVSAANLENGIEGRPVDKSVDQLTADVKAALEQRVVGRSGTVPADLKVQLERVFLVPRAASIVPAQSTIRAIVWVEGEDGARIVEPTEVLAKQRGIRAGGPIGIITAPNAERDYERTVAGFANNVTTRLFGE